jgi:hypothetical protein
MEAYAFDLQSVATLAKLVGSVFRFHFSQVGTQGTRLRKGPEYFRALPAKLYEGWLAVRFAQARELLPVSLSRMNGFTNGANGGPIRNLGWSTGSGNSQPTAKLPHVGVQN